MDREIFLKEKILSKHKDLKDFAVSISMPYSTLLYVIKNVGGSSLENVRKICKGLGLTLDDLYGNKDENLTSIMFANNRAAAGNGYHLEGDSYEVVKLPNVPKGADFAVQISGDSMEPLFYDGEVVFIKKQKQINIGEIGLFAYQENGYLKQLGNGMLVSLNANYDPIPIMDDDDSFKCFGKVIK